MNSEVAGTAQTALRHSFVSMLFALVVAEIAIQASTLFEVISDTPNGFGLVDMVRGASDVQSSLILAPLSHLVVVFVLVSTSWVGWSRSIDHDRDVQQIDSIEFWLLLIELLIVVLYFVLTRSVELGTVFDTSQGQESATISPPSAAPEAGWLSIIYVWYFIWDVFNDALPSKFPNEHFPWFERSPVVRWGAKLLSGVLARCWVSAICVFAAYAVFINVGASPNSALSAVAGDAALLCVVIWFWLAKAWEPWIVQNFFTWEKHRKGVRSSAEFGRHHVISLVIIPVYFLFFVLT